tara:strand:- start:628 stop:1359 length:732 start_codon:yes stop_codon:yes gene_type:complete
MEKKILVAVIAYNEGENIKSLLQELINFKEIKFDLVVIDDGSNDNTINICKELNVSYLKHAFNSGHSHRTLTTYFKLAYEKNYDVVCQVDGDGQHLVSELHKILTPILQNKYDYVFGSRFLKKGGYKSTFLRRLLIRLFSIILRLIIKKNITDSTSGFRAYNKNVIEFFALNYNFELFDPIQVALLIHFNGGEILEVEVKMKERISGRSEFTFLNIINFPIITAMNIIHILLRKNNSNFIKNL